MSILTSKKNFLKIVVLGDANVGKTSLLTRYTEDKSPISTKPTIGADFKKKEVVINESTVTVQIWDTAGQERYQSIGYSFYRGSDCCVIAFDITNRQSFENLSKWKEAFIENAVPSNSDNYPFICMGNKLDKQSDRVVSTNEAK